MAVKNMHHNTNPRPKERKSSPGYHHQKRDSSEEGRPFDDNDFNPGMQEDSRYKQQHREPVSYEPAKHVNPAKTTYYPPPPEEDGPGRYNQNKPSGHHQQPYSYTQPNPPHNQPSQNQPHYSQPPHNQHHDPYRNEREPEIRKEQPSYHQSPPKPHLVERGIQYEPPIHPERNERHYHSVPHEQEEENGHWPAPVQSSTLTKTYQRDEREITTTHQTAQRPTYQPPPPVNHSSHDPYNQSQQQQQQPSHQPPSHQTQQQPPTQQTQPTTPGRFDPQVILEKQRAKQGNYADPHYNQPTVTHYSQPPKPLTQNTSQNKPSERIENRPFQSSWNPHPKKVGDDKPTPGTVASRLAKFTNGPTGYVPAGHNSNQNNLQSHRNSPPPPTESYAPPSNTQKTTNNDRHNSGGGRKDVVATARGVFLGLGEIGLNFCSNRKIGFLEQKRNQFSPKPSPPFDYNGGVLSSLETGVSLVIPEGAIPYGQQQEIYFKVCHDENTLPTPANPMSGEKLMSPMVIG